MQKLTSYLSSLYELEPYGDGLILRTPIMYFGADHTFSFFIERAGNGGYTVQDRGQTLEFLRECTDADRYSERILGIMRHFSLTLDGNNICGFIPSVESGQTGRALHSYVLGVGIIANIYLI